MVEDSRGDLDKQSLSRDIAKVQADEKLDEEHESMSEAQEELEEVCVSQSKSKSILQPQA